VNDNQLRYLRLLIEHYSEFPRLNPEGYLRDIKYVEKIVKELKEKVGPILICDACGTETLHLTPKQLTSGAEIQLCDECLALVV
jgi:hypothetical protein